MQYHGSPISTPPVAPRRSRRCMRTRRPPSREPRGDAAKRRYVAAGRQSAFTFDLARSIVYTRQGNPAWAGQERDGIGADPAERSLLRGGDSEPDWVDLYKGRDSAGRRAAAAARQSDRLQMNVRIASPLPRFWYLPNGHRGGRGHDQRRSRQQWHGAAFRRRSWQRAHPAARVDDWACIRATSYIYTATPLAPATRRGCSTTAASSSALHVTTGCADYTSLDASAAFFHAQFADFGSSILRACRSPVTNRTHCIPWSDFVSHAGVSARKASASTPITTTGRLSWGSTSPGLFTGSGFPMRFATVEGRSSTSTRRRRR